LVKGTIREVFLIILNIVDILKWAISKKVW